MAVEEREVRIARRIAELRAERRSRLMMIASALGMAQKEVSDHVGLTAGRVHQLVEDAPEPLKVEVADFLADTVEVLQDLGRRTLAAQRDRTAGRPRPGVLGGVDRLRPGRRDLRRRAPDRGRRRRGAAFADHPEARQAPAVGMTWWKSLSRLVRNTERSRAATLGRALPAAPAEQLLKTDELRWSDAVVRGEILKDEKLLTDRAKLRDVRSKLRWRNCVRWSLLAGFALLFVATIAALAFAWTRSRRGNSGCGQRDRRVTIAAVTAIRQEMFGTTPKTKRRRRQTPQRPRRQWSRPRSSSGWCPEPRIRTFLATHPIAALARRSRLRRPTVSAMALFQTRRQLETATRAAFRWSPDRAQRRTRPGAAALCPGSCRTAAAADAA